MERTRRGAIFTLVLACLAACPPAFADSPRSVTPAEVERMLGYSELQPEQRTEAKVFAVRLDHAISRVQALMASEDVAPIERARAWGEVQMSWGMLYRTSPEIARQVLATILLGERQGGGAPPSPRPQGRDGSAAPTGADFYRQLASSMPEEPLPHERLADALLRTGDPSGAAAEAGRASELDPSRARPYQIRAGARYQLGDFGGAAEDARKTLQRDPANAAAASLLKLSDGRASLAAPAAPAPGAPEGPLTLVAGPSGSARPPLPAEALTGAAAARRIQSQRRVRDSAAYLGVGRPGDAWRMAAAAIEADPANPAAYFARAQAAMYSRRLEPALADVDSALTYAPGNERYLVSRAMLLNRLGRHEPALRAAAEALAVGARSAEGHYQMAWALAGLGRRAQALSHLETAARLSPNYYRPYREASRLPEDADLVGVFISAGEPAASPAPGPPERGGRRSLALWAAGVGACMLAGGAAFFWRRSGSRVEELSSRWVRSRRGYPGVEDGSDARAPADMPRELAGGKYAILRRLGAGGAGTTYEAQDRALKRRVAVKRIREELAADRYERGRILRETREQAALSHPRVVGLYEALEAGRELHLVSRFVEGGSLRGVLDSGPISLAQTLGWARDAAAALDYAHGRRVTHLGLKPSNILLDEEGRGNVSDFGVNWRVRQALGRMSAHPAAEQEAGYEAPEQEQGLPCPQSDVYALGVCLYEALTGRLPFPGQSSRRLMAKLSLDYAVPSSLASLPREVDEALARALAPEPSGRWASAGELISALEALASSARGRS